MSTDDDASEVGLRRLEDVERDRLLLAAIPAVIASLDLDGHPELTTVWFAWIDGVFWFTSRVGAPHVRRLQRDARAAFVVQEEDVVRSGGRPNRQVKARGMAALHQDHVEVTRRITRRYAPGQEELVARRALDDRVAVAIRPDRLDAVAGGPAAGRRG